MKIYFCYTVFLLYLCQCSAQIKGNENVNKVNIVYKVPVLFSADSIGLVFDSSFIYSYKQFKIYEAPTVEQSYEDNTLISESLESYFFGYDTNYSFGFYAKYLSDTLQTNRLSVDSFLKDRPDGRTMDNILELSSFSRELKLNFNELMKVYRINNPFYDSVFFYYNNTLKHLPFSFSKRLDSVYDSKLYKIETTFKRDTSKNALAFNKFRTATWILQEPKDFKNKAEILGFFKKIESMYKNGK